MTEEQKVEKLLQPRYKVIADYPESAQGNQVGFIYDRNDKSWSNWWFKQLPLYPHLFQPLPWWAEREESEMPEYVKIAKEPEYVFKVIEFTQDDYCYYRGSQDGKCGDFTSRFLPATSTEYNNYINKQLKG